eukprot:scaffold290218_cov36-Tisochrysis_lutea.AAC.3
MSRLSPPCSSRNAETYDLSGGATERASNRSAGAPQPLCQRKSERQLPAKQRSLVRPGHVASQRALHESGWRATSESALHVHASRPSSRARTSESSRVSKTSGGHASGESSAPAIS